MPIEVPPLRVRTGRDLEDLCEYFLNRSAAREGIKTRRLNEEAVELLKKYNWPGNVRELENLMERASILSMTELITAEAVKGWLQFDNDQAISNGRLDEPVSLATMERELIEQTLDRYDGHRLKTAQALGIGVRTLGMKLKKWKLDEQMVSV